jgi:Icc protein
MRIHSISPSALEVEFLNAGRSAGGYYVDRLPIHVAESTDLPNGLDAIVVTADLQGRELHQQSRPQLPLRLLGEVLPEQLRNDILPKLGIANNRVGAILAGDFYTVPLLDRRGGTGDVTSVWTEFGRHFEWVVGVAGNHDTFGEQRDSRPCLGSYANYLDEEICQRDGLRLAGLGGIIGNPSRHMRRSEDAYCLALDSLLCQEPQILVTHDGPNFPDDGYRGSDRVRRQLESLGPPLNIRGHSHWTEPLVELVGGTQVLNVDARVVIIRR